MTIQTSRTYASKKELAEALNSRERTVRFVDPSVFNPRNGGDFMGSDIAPGEKFAVVLDHPKRSRFATVQRKADGTFKVS